MNAPRSIRVNLRFGPRTHPELMKLISSLPPYKRARRLRQLLEEALKHAPDTRRPTLELLRRPIEENNAGDRNAGMEDARLSADVLALIGQSIRL
jgi:hypothetical protein